jgi:hypothetical protein
MYGHRNSSGALVVNGHHVQDTRQCVHCGTHWEATPKDAVPRAWCDTCRGLLCGSQPCALFCVPHEARLDLEEGRLTDGARPYKDEWEREQAYCKINAKQIADWWAWAKKVNFDPARGNLA